MEAFGATEKRESPRVEAASGRDRTCVCQRPDTVLPMLQVRGGMTVGWASSS